MSSPITQLFPDAPQRPAPAPSPALDALFPDARKEQAGRLEVLSRNPLASPDEVGEAAGLGRSLNLPTDVVARNLATIRPLAVQRGPDWERFIDDAPKTARWLENPVNHSLAVDDAENLGLLERISRSRFVQEFGGAMAGPTSGNVLQAPTPIERGILSAEWRRGQLQVERGQLGTLSPTERNRPDVRARVAAIDAELAQPLPEAEGFARLVRGSTRILPGMTAGAVEGGAGAMAGAVVGGTIGALAGGVGVIPGAVAGAKVGGIFGGVQETASQIGGNLTLDLEQKGVDASTADLAGRAAGWLGGGVEFSNVGLILSPFQRFLGTGMAQALTRPTVRSAVANATKYYAANLATETGEELVQTGITLAAENIAGSVSGVNTGVTGERVLDELSATAVETLVSMALLPIPGTALVGIEGLAQAQTAVSRRNGLAQAMGLSKASKTRTRYPEAFRAIVKEQADGQVVYLDAERASVLLQENEVTPEQFVQAAGITMQDWAQAVEGTGTDLVIPVDALLANLSDVPLGEALLPELRFEVSGPTQREAEAMFRDAEKFRERVAQETANLGEIVESDPAYRVVEDIRQKLDATGQYTPEQVQIQAQAVAKPYAVWARAIASQNPDNPLADPWTLYSRKGGLSVLGGQRSEAVFDAEMAVARARREGRTIEEVEALRERVTKLTDERVAIRAVLEEADQTLDVRDEQGRLRQNLRNVSTDALVTEYVRLRDIAMFAETELLDIEAAFSRAEAESGAVVSDEEVAGRVEEAGFSGKAQGFEDAETWTGKRAAYDRHLRSLRNQAKKVQRSVPRLGAELASRGVENPDQYLIDNGLEGATQTMRLADVPFQRPVTRAELVISDAAEAREFQARGFTLRDIADELGTSVERVKALLKLPPVPVPDDVRLRLAFNGVEMLMQAAFHGSPYVFDRFDLSKIGTGEGAQAFGFGLYFAEAEEVAEGYRKNLTQFRNVYDGQEVDYQAPSERMDPAELAAYRFVRAIRSGDTEAQAKSDVVSGLLEDADSYEGGVNQGIADRMREAAEIAQTLDPFKVQTRGALYRVDIPDEAVARMLDWDKPYAKQAKSVKDALKKAGFTKEVARQNLGDYDNGENIYQWLANTGGGMALSRGDLMQGSPEAASKFLNSIGIPGIKYLDAGSRQDGDGTRNLVVFDDALVTITHRNGEPVTAAERADFLAQGSGNRPNAYYLRGNRVIGLMQGANLSSFLHEMSHDYLATLEVVATDPDAPAWLVQDFETAIQHIGVKDEDRVAFVQYLRTGMGRTDKETKAFVAAEERWARGFESYLEKGEAPSRDLLRAFANFRVWLGQVYRKVKAMLVPISPELRGVFDRMLATDEEIAEYRQFPEAKPLFTERPDGMTDAQWEEYTKGFQTRDALIGGALAKRILVEQRAAVDADWQNKRAEVEARIREELASDPVTQAVTFLREGVDGQPMKLNRALLNAVAPDMWKSLPKGTTAADGEMTLDAVVLRFGFPDEATLVSQLQRYEEADAVVARRLSETFKREYGDLLGDSTAMAEAVAEITHRAETDDAVVRELKTLGRTLGIRVVDKPALVQVAKDMVAGMAVADIVPSRYERAEAKEARLSEQALRKGETAKAAFHKRRQLLNRILVRETQAALKDAEKVRAFAVRMAGESAQATLGKAGVPFTDAMNAILTDYEFARVPRKQIARRAALDAYVKDVTEKGGVPMLAPEMVEDARVVNYRALTMEQLRGVDAAMRQIWHHAKNLDTIAKEGRKLSLQVAEQMVVESLETYRPNTPMSLDDYPLSLNAAKERAKAIDAWHLPPTFLFRWLDGDNYGETWQMFYAPIKDAKDAELVRMKDAAERVKQIEAMVELPPLLLDTPKQYDGIRTPMTKRKILALASNWGNISSREAVLEATTGDGYPQFGSAASIERMFAEALTVKDWAYIQARWDYANEFWPDIAELARRTSGITPDKVEASPFLIQAKDGVANVRGGYYPLSYDREAGRGRGKEAIADFTGETELGSLRLAGAASAQTRHGWENVRVGSAGKPINLSPGVWNKHIADVIHDLTHREAIRDVYALLSRPAVRQAFVRSAGLPYYDAVKAWLFRVADPNRVVGDTSFVEKLMSTARVGTTAVNLGLKFSTGVAQTLGYLQSVEAIGPKWMAVGLAEVWPVGMFWRGNKAVDFVMESSPMMANRKFNYNRDVADYARSKFGKLTNLDAFNFWFIGYMDGMVSVPTWIGAYRKAMASNGNDHAAAVRVADDTVEATQGAGSPKDLSRIQGGPELRKLLTMHYTAFSRMYGQFRRAGYNKQIGKYGWPRFLAALSLLWFGQVVLSELLQGGDEEKSVESWLYDLAVFPANLVVLARDVVRGVGPEQWAYNFSPAESAFERTAKAVDAVYRETLGDLFFGADREMTETEAKALIEAPGYWLRLPSKAVWQYGDYLMDWTQGEVAPANPLEAARGFLMNRR